MAVKTTTKKTDKKTPKKTNVYGTDSKGRYVIVNGKKCRSEKEFLAEIAKGTDD